MVMHLGKQKLEHILNCGICQKRLRIVRSGKSIYSAIKESKGYELIEWK